jgi:hypothetical protein
MLATIAFRAKKDLELKSKLKREAPGPNKSIPVCGDAPLIYGYYHLHLPLRIIFRDMEYFLGQKGIFVSC